MLYIALLLALTVIVLVGIFVIVLVVTHKVGFVDDGTFQRYSHIATIVGLPLGVIGAIGATVAIAALLVRDRPSPPPPSPSPSPTIEIAQNSPRPLSSVTPVPSQAPTAPTAATVSSTAQGQQEGTAKETRPQTNPQDSATGNGRETRYDRGDIGMKKENGYYEITLENAKTSQTCTNGFARISNQEKLINVTFSIRAAHLEVPSIPTGRDVDTYYIEDTEGRRYQMSCGDGRYFNVSLNSFEGKPNPKTLTVSFVVPINAQRLQFRFTPPVGNAIVVTLPTPL